MIANLSSFIEFFAAVYVTMCISNDIFLRFWTAAHYTRIEGILKEQDFPGGPILYQQLFEKIKEFSNNVNNISIKRGAFMLSFSILLLIYIGFETTPPAAASSAALLMCVIPTLVVLCLHRIILKKWKFVILSIATVVGIFIWVLCKYEDWAVIHSTVSLFEKYLRHIIVLVILLPIIHQLIINWLFSSVYRGYLSNIAASEYEKYIASKNGVKQKNKELIDKEYLAVWNDSYFKDGGYDLSLSGFNEVLEARLIKAINPSSIKLICSLLLFKIKCLVRTISNRCALNQKQLSKTVQTPISQTLEGIITDEYKNTIYNCVLDFSNEYQDFLKWKKQTHSEHPSLKLYCDQHSIKYKDMVAWVKVHKPTK